MAPSDINTIRCNATENVARAQMPARDLSTTPTAVLAEAAEAAVARSCTPLRVEAPSFRPAGSDLAVVPAAASAGAIRINDVVDSLDAPILRRLQLSRGGHLSLLRWVIIFWKRLASLGCFLSDQF